MELPSSALPWITPDEPGVGGRIKSTPASFVVEEVPLYEPCGSGEHVYVRVRREGWTTRDLADALARAFGADPRSVGFAGLKDKVARVTQTFSVPFSAVVDVEAEARARTADLPVDLLWARRHTNKLRPGHLRGNRFDIVIDGVVPDALDRARRITAELARRGLPNFFGEQRLGSRGDNAVRGRRLLASESAAPAQRSSWAGRLLLSAYQSQLFNAWLGERIALGWFERLVTGDVAKRSDSGGVFVVADAASESTRFDARAIQYTGPIYGTKMPWAEGEPGRVERELLARFDVDPAWFARARVAGGRRGARCFVDAVASDAREGGLLLAFTLPKGSYATVLLREIVKSDELE